MSILSGPNLRSDEMARAIPSGYTILWEASYGIPALSFVCGHCANRVGGDRGYWAKSTYDNQPATFIYICPFCARPTYIDNQDRQIPGPMPGSSVTGLADDGIAQLYEEARRCVSATAYTAAVLSCRKLLMHVAVAKGADEGLKFAEYVQYLADKNYIPPDAKPWVDHIRSKSNEANHEISIMKEADARELLSFSEMLLKVVFEFPARVNRAEASS